MIQIQLNHGSLFSGIGGFDIAADKMGWINKFHCEINSFGRQVLNYYWPEAISYEDIKKTDFTIWRGRIDILTGGFPCQPFSVAGNQLGTEDDRHLWPEYFRAICEIQPRWIVGENVPGLVNWNGGMVFDEVQADLESEGYEVIPFILPACGVNAPHRRDRIWFIGYAEHHGLHATKVRGNDSQPSIQTGENKIWKFTGTDSLQTSNASNSTDAGIESLRRERENAVHEPEITSNTDGNGHELRGSGKDRSTQNQSQREQNKREWIWSNHWRISKPWLTSNTPDNGRGRWKNKQSGYIGDGQIQQNEQQGSPSRCETQGCCGECDVTDTQSIGVQRNGTDRKQFTRPQTGQRLSGRYNAGNYWREWPTQPPIRERNDGFSGRLDRSAVYGPEDTGRGDVYTRWRTESIKAMGNAVVPQVVLQIFKAIEQFEILITKQE